MNNCENRFDNQMRCLRSISELVSLFLFLFFYFFFQTVHMLPISFMSQMKQGQIERLASSTISDVSSHHILVVIIPPALTEDECSVLSKGLNFIQGKFITSSIYYKDTFLTAPDASLARSDFKNVEKEVTAFNV